jgi:hypothetical protein
MGPLLEPNLARLRKRVLSVEQASDSRRALADSLAAIDVGIVPRGVSACCATDGKRSSRTDPATPAALHLGIDLFARPGTALRAALDRALQDL